MPQLALSLLSPHECRLFHHLRKDSRLYSYLPVVGVTLKLYNLLPHPTVKRTFRVNDVQESQLSTTGSRSFSYSWFPA